MKRLWKAYYFAGVTDSSGFVSKALVRTVYENHEDKRDGHLVVNPSSYTMDPQTTNSFL
jgi:hypothetical protein